MGAPHVRPGVGEKASAVGRGDVDTARMSTVDDRDASTLNRELTQLLTEAGSRFGFDVALEYPVRGGRLDVVWTWQPPFPMPGLERPVPIVGFEIESSWRTRKHVKGDLLNLHDAGVGLGVIVLAGTDPKDEGLRRFAELLVDRPGPTVLVWTAQDVRSLAAQRHVASMTAAATAAKAPDELLTADPKTHTALAPATGGSDGPSATATHAGKYAALYRWLSGQEATSLTLTFAQVEDVLGFPLPASSRHHVPHWHSYDGSAVARAIIDAGWTASKVHLADEELTLVRASP
jgi:hypothetical protein